MHSIPRRVLTKCRGLIFRWFFRPDQPETDLLRIGTDYGGWWVPRESINSSSMCLCAGVGLDISFDLGLIQEFGCNVIAVDPTPQTIEWIAKLDLPNGFNFIPVGIGGATTEAKFYAPSDPTHVSHSIKNLQGTTAYFTAQLLTLSDLMSEFAIPKVDLLKLDIEGAEHDAIERMLADSIHPTVICIEVDQPEPIRLARQTISLLRRSGYNLRKVDGFNFTFSLAPSTGPLKA